MSEKLIQEILLKMKYDPSMTLKENQNLIEQSRPSTAAQQDVLTPKNYTSPQQRALERNPQEYLQGLELRYKGNTRPEKPRGTQSIYQKGTTPSESGMTWELPYPSSRAKIALCKNSNCTCTKSTGPFCRGTKGKKQLEEVFQNDLEDWNSDQLNFTVYKFSDQDKHLWLPVASTLLFFSGLGPVAYAAGAVLEIADANLYWKEGDEVTAAIAALFAILGLNEIESLIPGLKGWGRKQVITFLNKLKSGKPLSPSEKTVADQIKKNQKILVTKSFKRMNRTHVQTMARKHGLPYLVTLALRLIKSGLWMGAKTIGGVSLVAIGYALGLKIKELNNFEKPSSQEIVKAKKIIKNPETKKQIEEFTLAEVNKTIKDAQTPEAQKMIAKQDSIASSYWESSLEQMGLQDEI